MTTNETAEPAQPEIGDTGRAVVRPLDRPGDLGWVVVAHGEIYAAEFGWDTSFEALVARIVADYAGDHDPSREAAWIAEVDGQRAGCVFCVAGDDETTAKLRILLVDPAARGHGLGARLVDTCIGFARDAGYRRITLWTNDVLGSRGGSTRRPVRARRGGSPPQLRPRPRRAELGAGPLGSGIRMPTVVSGAATSGGAQAWVAQAAML